MEASSPFQKATGAWQFIAGLDFLSGGEKKAAFSQLSYKQTVAGHGAAMPQCPSKVASCQIFVPIREK